MSCFNIYDLIEVVGGLIGAFSILIGITIIFAMGLLNGHGFIQILSDNTPTIMILAICGIGFTLLTIAVSKFMMIFKILDKYNGVST
jgi:hypothetical protein